MEHFDTIHNSPSHIYHSALPFPPSSSWLCKSYSAELSQEVQVVKGLPAEWGTCLHIVSLGSTLHDLYYQNDTITVGSGSGDIIILNAITGSQTAVLSGHGGPVRSVTYSPDGISLVSGSEDTTVKLWDVQTGGVVKTFYGHTFYVLSISISADCTRIASGSKDYTIRLWNVQTGECDCVIDQEHKVKQVSFLPTDPQHFLSICGDKVRQWDIDGCQIGHAYDGSYIAFSSDGTQFVSCYMGTVTVKNYSSGVIAAGFQIDNNAFQHCHFSPDSRLIAVTTRSTVYVWDINSPSPNPIETFTGHTKTITSPAFSSPSSLISASRDKSIKFWQIGSSPKDPKSTLFTLDDPRLITLQAKDGIIITGDSDGVVKSWDIFTGLCKASFQTPARDSNTRDARLINGKLILCWCTRKRINIWDGELHLAADGPEYSEDLKMSEDGSRVFFLARGFIHAWSIQTGESVGMVELGYNSSRPLTENRSRAQWPQEYELGSLTVDSSRVWTWDNSELCYKGWDFGTPDSSPVQLPKTPRYRLHPNGIMLWEIDLLRVKDTRTGKVVFQLPKRYGEPFDVGWNDQYLVAYFSLTDVLVLDFGHILK